MKRIISPLFFLILASVGAFPLFLTDTHGADEKNLAFNVYLGENNTPIGQHYFKIKPHADGGYTVSSRCKFDVNIFFFNAYSYNHHTQEVWQDGCLQRFKSKTIENGDSTMVQGQKNKQSFVWQVNENEQKSTTDCVRSFAYWKPDYLMAADKLFNPQTGEIERVDISKEDVSAHASKSSPLSDSGVKIGITADELDIQVWYNRALEWRGLTSKIDGNTLIYERKDTLENSYEDLF